MEQQVEPIKRSLYDVTSEYIELMDRIEEGGGELTERLEAELEQIEGDFESKIEARAFLVRRLKAEADALLEQELVLRNRREAWLRRVEAIRLGTLRAMEQAGFERVKTPVATVYIGRSQKVVIDDEDALPAELWRERDPEVDKKELGARLKAGETVPGAHLATTSHLNIR